MARTPPPAKKPQRKRDTQITLRVAQAEYETFKRAADELELPLTTWIRLVCRKASGMPTL